MTPLRVAVWGLGRHSLRNIIPALAGGVSCTLAGVLSRRPQAAAKTCAEWKCATWNSPREMLSDRTVDVVFVTTPIGLHAEHGMEALAAGKHLWCEKPLSSDAFSALELVELSRRIGRSIAEGFMYLYHPHFLRLREMVESGSLGYIHQLNCRFGIPELAEPGFRNDASLGGGAFLDVGSYPLSAVVSLLKDEEPAVMYSRIETRAGELVDSGGGAVLRTASGTICNLEWAAGVSYRNEIDVWGSQGSVFTDRIFSKGPDYVPEFRVRDAGGVERIEVGESANHFSRMMDAFAALASDREGAERERSLITRRARMMDETRERSHQGQGR